MEVMISCTNYRVSQDQKLHLQGSNFAE